MDFRMDPRAFDAHGDGCDACCCEAVSMQPGEAELFRLDYSGWIAANRAKSLVQGLTQISVQQIKFANPQIASDVSFTISTPGTLAASVALPSDAVGTTYSVSTQPQFGTLSIQTNGAFSYVASSAKTAADSFLVAVLQNGETTLRRIAVQLTSVAAFSFIITPQRSYFGAVVPQAAASNAVYQVRGATLVSSIYNGPAKDATPGNIAALAGTVYVTWLQTALGWAQVRSDGQFLYMPNDGACGYDTFDVDIITGGTTTHETVSILIPGVWVDPASVNVGHRILSFSVAAGRSAPVGATYRISLSQAAQDCNSVTTTHVSCFDVTVSKC